jgi:hypothetical protein
VTEPFQKQQGRPQSSSTVNNNYNRMSPKFKDIEPAWGIVVTQLVDGKMSVKTSESKDVLILNSSLCIGVHI